MTRILFAAVFLLCASGSAFGQISSEEAYERLRLRQIARVAATQPTTQPTTQLAEYDAALWLVERDRQREAAIDFTARQRTTTRPIMLLAPLATRTVDNSPSAMPSGNFLGGMGSDSGGRGGGTVQVDGYTRRDGTYVRPHTRSAPRR